MDPILSRVTASSLALIAIAACSGEPAPQPGRAVLEPHVFVSAAWDSTDAFRGRLRVPAVRGQSAAADSIELVFELFPTTSETPGPPIIYLAGGPGSSGINSARYARFPLFMAMRELGDVIALDQRGANESNPVGDGEDECEVYRPRPTDRPLTDTAYIRLSLEAAEQCAVMWREMGIDLAAYTTPENAADIVDLSRALGASKVRLWAISYGTHLALSILRDHSDLVERAILAGVEGPDHTVKLPEASERQLETLFDLVESDPGLAARFPSLRATVEEVLSELGERPVTLEFEAPDGSEPQRVVVGAPELRRLTISLLRDPWTMVDVPSVFSRVARGDLSDLPASPEVRFELEAMPEATDAASGMSAERADRFRAQDSSTVLGGGAQLRNAFMAEALGVQDLGDRFRAPVRADVPVLVISGTLDGRTPVANAEEVLPGLTNAARLVIENAGHSDDLFLSSPEILPAMIDFMAGRPVEDRRLQVDPPDFSTVREPAPIAPDVARTLVGEYERAPGDVWRILPHGTVRARDPTGRMLSESAVLQIRFEGNGFPLRAAEDGSYFVDFPGIRERPITFVVAGRRVVALELVNREGRTERMPRVPSGAEEGF